MTYELLLLESEIHNVYTFRHDNTTNGAILNNHLIKNDFIPLKRVKHIA